MFKAQYSNIQKPPLGAHLDRGHPLARSLIGLWLFNEGRGNQDLTPRMVKDLYKGSVGLGPPGTVNSLRWESRFGKYGIRFSAVTEGVFVGQNILWRGPFSNGWTMIWGVVPLA